MVNKRGLAVILLMLVLGGFVQTSCVAPYYYDHGHRYWRDGHDDDWHRAHGDHWDENYNGR